MSFHQRRGAVALLFACVFAGGCARTYHEYDKFVQTPPPLVTTKDYKLSPPDELLISSPDVPEIDNRAIVIRPDGKINLPLVGTVFVAGRTPEQVQEELEDIANEFYEKRPNITVRVLQFNSKKVYVFGEVSLAGSYTYTGANTVIDTLAQAQPTRMADLSRIRVVRPGTDPSTRDLMTIDLEKMAFEGDSGLNVVLEEGDVIFVPPHPLAAVGLTLQQLLLPLQPAAMTITTPMRFNAAFRTLPGG